MSIDSREFRDTVGRFATGVTVITTVAGDGELFGLTANSFSSLSLDPPLVLFWLDNNAMSFEAFNETPYFAVNVLSEDQRDLSSHFARSGADKWNGVEYATWDTGSPILPGCLAALECDTQAIHDGGDHVIIVGKVRKLMAENDMRRPLVFYQGSYNGLSA